MWWPSEQQWARVGVRDATVGGRSEVMVSRRLSVLLEAQRPFLSCTVTCCSNPPVSLCYWWWWHKHIFLVFHLYSSLSLSLFGTQHILGLTPSTDPLCWWLLPLLWVSWPISSSWGPFWSPTGNSLPITLLLPAAEPLLDHMCASVVVHTASH